MSKKMISATTSIETEPIETDDASAKDSRRDGQAESIPEGARRSLLREYFESAIVTFLMALFFMTFVAQAAAVPTASMENTINVGDHFLINKFIFAQGPHAPFLPQREIRRGDIVVFKYPSDKGTDDKIVQYQTLYIKRVIGLPGETVEVRGADVLINGQVIPEHRVVARDPEMGNDHAALRDLTPTAAQGSEPYTVYYRPETISPARGGHPYVSPGFSYGVHGPEKIPADSYFMMGDNRDNSADSRYFGFVKRDLIVGRAMFVIWSFDESAAKSTMPLIGPVLDFFHNTRWSRTGTLIK